MTFLGVFSFFTFSLHFLMVDVSSLTTISTHFRLGSFNFCTCFFTMASKARSGVKRPVLHGRGRVGGSNKEEESEAEKEQRRKERRKEKGKERKQGKMRSEILVHSISLLNQVSIAMGPVHCQVSGESTGKWMWQREGGGSKWAGEMVSCEEQDERMATPRDQMTSS